MVSDPIKPVYPPSDDCSFGFSGSAGFKVSATRAQPILSSPPSQSLIEITIPPCSGKQSIGATTSLAFVLPKGRNHLSARSSWNSESIVKQSIRQSFIGEKS